MFNTNLGNKVVPIMGSDVPTQTRKATRRDTLTNTMPKPIPALFYVATENTKTGTIYLKVINTSGSALPITLDIKGTVKLAGNATLTVLKSDKIDDTNTIEDPKKVVPVTSTISGVSKTFTHTFDPYSINVLVLNRIKAK